KWSSYFSGGGTRFECVIELQDLRKVGLGSNKQSAKTMAAQAMIHALRSADRRSSNTIDQSLDQSQSSDDSIPSSPKQSIESTAESRLITPDEPSSSSSSVDDDTNGRGS